MSIYIHRKYFQSKIFSIPFPLRKPLSPSLSPIIKLSISAPTMSTSNQEIVLKKQIELLQKKYTACDIADALVKLKVPGAGFLPDLKPAFTSPSESFNIITIAPVSTVIFAAKNSTDLSKYPTANIPTDKHWVDLTVSDSIVIISQPEGQKNAVLGGIMAMRAKVLGAKGVIVSGRVRDLQELEATGLPVWSRGTSIVGAGAESKPHAVQVALKIDGTDIHPGDLAFCDPDNGVVIIPQEKIADVISILPDLVAADERVKEEVMKGMSAQEAFKKHRG
ncbi:uncharacterized protein Bfra_006879 [Botrytis fragariae]|uniref:DlpA domain-containing protein n=1 Tax=Botrytis fragariae TaxID=1964551 RepID=A0A8H6B628_9HELO|nr:uncharacterized protein Bfra_006879 [Botrytis fragariae]KAF5879672.1 hypothetical protein Bfra_006879 [Botrytis fragariae]